MDKLKAPILECTGELMPNVPNMTDFFKQLGSLPAVLSLQLAQLPLCISIALWDDIKSVLIQPLDATEDLLGALSPTLPSQTTNSVRDRPEEWRRRADDLQENYKLYFMLGLINLLGTFASHILAIPLPFISGCTVGDLTSKEGRKKIRDTIFRNLKSLIPILPEPFRSICEGKFGLLSPEEVLRNFISYWVSEVKKIILNPLYAVFTFLIKKFKKVWDSLKLPNIPAILALDAPSIIMSLITPYISNTIGAVNAVLSIQIPILGLTLGQLLGIKSIDDLALGAIITPQAILARLCTRLANVFQDIVSIILEEWIQKVKKFLDKIGLGAIFSLVPLTFCKFLKLLLPQLFSLGNTVTATANRMLDTATKVSKIRADLDLLRANPEANAGQIKRLESELTRLLPAAIRC